MMGRRILIDARLPWGSGIGRYVRNIVPKVAQILPEIDLTLLVSVEDEQVSRAVSAISANLSVRITDIEPFSLYEQVSLPLLASEYDLTWFTNYWIPLAWRGRFVTTVHDMLHLDPRFPVSALKRSLARQAFAKVRRRAEHIIFDSRFTARAFRAEVGEPNAASIVHLGIDHLMTDATHIVDRREKTALVVATAKEHKNLAMLLEAWQEAALDGWTLVLVMPDQDLRSSVDIAGQAERITNVCIRRGISDAELITLYTSAGFVIIPSRYEGFGLPLLEAMLAGTPVISSTADALVEVATGALIPFVDADDFDGWVQAIRGMARAAILSDEWRKSVDCHNQSVARSFTWERAALSTAAILMQASTER